MVHNIRLRYKKCIRIQARTDNLASDLISFKPLHTLFTIEKILSPLFIGKFANLPEEREVVFTHSAGPSRGLCCCNGNHIGHIDLVIQTAPGHLRLELPGLDLVEVHRGVGVEGDIDLVMVLQEGVGSHLFQPKNISAVHETSKYKASSEHTLFSNGG